MIITTGKHKELKKLVLDKLARLGYKISYDSQYYCFSNADEYFFKDERLVVVVCCDTFKKFSFCDNYKPGFGGSCSVSKLLDMDEPIAINGDIVVFTKDGIGIRNAFIPYTILEQINERAKSTKEINMLVLTRKPGEKIIIGEDIILSIVRVEGDKVRLGIEAPKHVKVDREEVRKQKESV